MTRASGQSSYYLGDNGAGRAAHLNAQQQQQPPPPPPPQQQQQQKLKQNRGQSCCCVFQLAKRLGADGWRVVFGNSSAPNSTAQTGDGAAAASAASASGAAGIPLTPMSPGAAMQQQQQPPPPLGPCGLVGLENQGATCYLNSLVQVIAASPELRRAIFAVSPEQLGLDEHGFPLAGGDQGLRRIPYELQRLLARVLLSESAYVSTQELTGSFGWNGRDLGDQHDVQELNRLLMHALEESLVDTEAYRAIKTAVAGAFVTCIECQNCSSMSNRSEEFMDLCLATVGFASLEESLRSTFGGSEKLEGQNQYRCDSCGKMVDAKKFCRLETLPPILTLSLMRFNFDRNRMQRVKNESKFSFPEQLDLRPYVSSGAAAAAAAVVATQTDGKRHRGGGEFQYELYAVIAHCGSAMGGHYRAFVLDLERRGGSQHLLQQQHQIPLLQRCLVASADGDGESAPLSLHPVGSNGNLAASQGSSAGTLPKHQHSRSASSGSGVSRNGKQQQQQQQNQQRQWFVFSDTQVRQVQDSVLKEQFAGHECAYMLFYRRLPATASSSAATAAMANNSAISEIPGWLCKSVLAENESVRQRREEFETAANTVSFDVFGEGAFRLDEDLLIFERLLQANQSPESQEPPLEMMPLGSVSIDCRLPVAELLRRVENAMSAHVNPIGSVLLLEYTNCGYYCLAKLSELPNSSVQIRSTYQLGLPNNPVVLLCLSGQPPKLLLFGEENRPLNLTLRLFNQPPTERPFTRSASLFKCLRSALLPLQKQTAESPDDESPLASRKRFKAELDRTTVYLKRASVYSSYPLNKSDEIPRERFKRSLGELGIRDGDALVVRLNASASAEAGAFDAPDGGRFEGGSAVNGGTASRGLSIVDVIFQPEDTLPEKHLTVEVKFDNNFGELKAAAVDELCREAGADVGKGGYSGYRLLVYNDQMASYCPEYENILCHSLRYNTRPVRLEQAPAFADNQIFVRIRLLPDWQATPQQHIPQNSSTLSRAVNLIVDGGMATSELRRLAASNLVSPELVDAHHLRFQSAGRALDEIKEGESLFNSRIRHRASVCLVPGEPLSIGQLRLRVYERLQFGPDWQTVLTAHPERQFPHRCNLAVDEAGGGYLDALQRALSKWLERNDPPGQGRQMRLYSFRPTESKLVKLLQKYNNIRPLADPGCAVAFELRPIGSPEPPLATMSSGIRILLYLTVKPQQQQQQQADYPPPEEFWWDCTSNCADGDGAAGLHRQVARHLDWPNAEVRLAKRLHPSCTWWPLPATAASLQRGTDLREFDVLGCMRASAAGSSGLDRFESPADLRLLAERGGGFGGGGGGGGTWVAGMPSSGAVPMTSHERGLVINVPKYGTSGGRDKPTSTDRGNGASEGSE